uniref:trans-cinnamate 4-monooxygenase n=1 Tax=Conocephalum japonicum TaxID=134427 RepID=A0A1Z2R7G6_CONJP|nr:cinnamate 4-hydroxylase [Conocephalum japonicum]
MAVCLVAAGVSGVKAQREAVATSSGSSFTTVQYVLYGLLAAALGLILVMKLKEKKLKLPPGPPGVPIFGNWLQIGDDLNHRNLSELAKKYGEVVLLKMGQRNYVIVSSSELAKEVLHTQGVEFGSRTRNVVFDIFTGNGQDMVFTVYGDHWRRMRRIMTVPFFTNKVVMQSRFAWEDEISHVIKDLTASKEASTTGVIIRRRLQLMMYNIMYRMMFDRRFETVDDPLFVKLKAVNGERSRLAQSFEYNYGDFIPILRPFLRKYLAYCQELKDKRLALFKDYFIEERKKVLSTRGSNEGEKAAIDYIFESEQKGEINEDNVLYIVENINVAAIETTLWSIEWGVAELCNNPEMLKRLRNELDSTLGRGNLICEPDIPRLPYLAAFVKEVMRLHMAIPLLVPHMNLHQAKLAGYDIPAESKILVNAWWIANNPAYWVEPEKFNPDRFLDGKIESNGNDFRFLPFGSGRRSCPGIIIAIPLLSLVLGSLVQSFDLLPPPGVDKIDMTEKGGQFSLFIKNHYNMVVKPRSD